MNRMQLTKMKRNFIYTEKIEGCIRIVMNGNGGIYLELVHNDILKRLFPNKNVVAKLLLYRCHQ